MRFSVAAVATLAAGAAAWTPANNATLPKYTTEVVTAYTTYCPSPTSIVHGGKTYTVTKATTLTITNCPCTITKPYPSAPVHPTPPPVKPVGPPSPPKNGTTPTKYTYTVASPSASKPAQFTGAANKAVAASGAGLAAIFGMAAYLL